ncbi:Sfh1p [Sporobolomyces koalae]|uniref:Sfh1p n=1 Tax=Sporobolomyces koalae TaxID=500713 RepID=UPI003172F947
MSGYGYPGQPLASSSTRMSTPTTSRSGRAIKPVKQYQIQHQPQSQSSSSRPSRSSALNPNSSSRSVPVRHQLGTTAHPVLPLTRITQAGHEGKQGMFTSYPTRMRLGTSSLMQPSALAPAAAAVQAAVEGGVPTRGSGTSTPIGLGPGAGKRQRSTVNYAELGQISDPEDDDPDEPRSKRGTSGVPGIVPKKALVERDLQPWGDGKSYLGVLPPGNMVTVQPAVKTRHVAATEEQLEDLAEIPAAFVPIQIDLDYRTFKIRDSFVWNVHEKLITPDSFARTFCDDLELGPEQAAEVSRQISEQIDEQAGMAEIAFTSPEDERDMAEKDLRVIINLDVQIGTLHVRDRIEWDLTSSLTPELFAATLVRDLSLPTSAAPIISHALHEEISRLKKSCLEMGLVGADDWQLRRKGSKPLEGIWREWTEAQTFGPIVERLTLDELDKVEAERERASRRAKRERLAGPRVGRPRR